MPLPHWGPNVGYVCKHRDWFRINRDYQREKDVWSAQDEKHLIDTILRDLDIPKLYFRKIGEKEYEIVDGQQRLQTIWRFRDGNLSLDGKISGPELDGLKYDDLPEELTEQFDTYQLDCVILHGYDDEKVRMMFRKLQRGKPLNPAEKINAYPGSIVPLMRDLGKHSFFKSIRFSMKRYKSYWLVSNFLILEHKGIIDISPRNVYDFFIENANLTSNTPIPRKVRRTLNILYRTFPDKTPQLSKPSWIINVYLLTSHIIDNYVFINREDDLRDFYTSFWKKMEEVAWTGKGSPESVRFVAANSSGTTSKRNIKIRFDIMLRSFLDENLDLQLFDPKRYFDHFEKTVIYTRNQEEHPDKKARCEECGKEVGWDEYEADHIKAYVKGGETTIENGQVLCRECNRKKGAG